MRLISMRSSYAAKWQQEYWAARLNRLVNHTPDGQQSGRFELHSNANEPAPCIEATRDTLSFNKRHHPALVMPPKKVVGGLQRVNGEWVKHILTFEPVPTDWAVNEACHSPEPWLGEWPHLHALRLLALLADASAIKLLLKLQGSDRAKCQQLRELVGHDATADRVHEAVESVLDRLDCVPPRRLPLEREPRYDSPVSSVCESDVDGGVGL